jgi:DNA-directed RNA polymerase subunit M/transcription elongation factor TFIIS
MSSTSQLAQQLQLAFAEEIDSDILPRSVIQQWADIRTRDGTLFFEPSSPYHMDVIQSVKDLLLPNPEDQTSQYTYDVLTPRFSQYANIEEFIFVRPLDIELLNLKEQTDVERRITQFSVKVKGPQCKKCGGENTIIDTRQTRRADEPFSVKIKCLDCIARGAS